MRTITWYSPAEFMTQFKPASWGEEPTWDEVVAQMLDCPIDYETVSILQRVRRREGGFREPVHVDEGRVANGMHRSVACIIDDLSIPVREWGEETPDPHMVEVEWSCWWLKKGPPPDEDDGELLCALRSFPLDDETWAETDVMSGCAGKTKMSAMYYCPASKKDLLLRILAERAAKVDYLLVVTSDRCGTFDELYPDEPES